MREGWLTGAVSGMKGLDEEVVVHSALKRYVTERHHTTNHS